MNGAFVGTWNLRPSGESLQYDNDWVASEQGRPLSLSLRSHTTCGIWASVAAGIGWRG